MFTQYLLKDPTKIRAGVLDTFKEQMGLRGEEHRGQGKCICGQGKEIKENISLKKGTKDVNILLMQSAFITNNPHLLSPIPTSGNKTNSI